jgi:hypothetical protein
MAYVGLLVFYAALFVVIWTFRPYLPKEERRTAIVIGAVWAPSVFVANFLLFKAGLMSFLPWPNNVGHTFLWIGVGLTWLYLSMRRSAPWWAQFVVFATFSLVVKYAEHLLIGSWEHEHFFHVFRGNFAYILGWSLADGLYPVLTLVGLRLLGSTVKDLEVI